MPSLRERKEDIPVLVNHLIKSYKSEFHKNIKGIDDEAIAVLLAYDWPGNVRQLHNVVERMMLIAQKDIITVDLVPQEIQSDMNGTRPVPLPNQQLQALEDKMASYIQFVVNQSNGNIKRASEILGVSRGTIYRALKHLEE